MRGACRKQHWMNQGTHIMNFNRIGAAILALTCGALPGCATISESNQQEVAVRAILDHREIAGVGCVLSNKAGRWFVRAPGRVTVQKNDSDLRVACKKDGVAVATELWHPHYGTDKIIGNALLTGGLGEYVDRHSGAGFDYQANITVLMHAIPSTESTQTAAPANNVY